MTEEPVSSVTQGVTKVASGVVDAIGSSPLTLALVLVNVAFLGFSGFLLREVALGSRERNKSQNEMITQLMKDIRDCHQPPSRRDPTATPIKEHT
jgi:hypothetical protein